MTTKDYIFVVIDDADRSLLGRLAPESVFTAVPSCSKAFRVSLTKTQLARIYDMVFDYRLGGLLIYPADGWPLKLASEDDEYDPTKAPNVVYC